MKITKVKKETSINSASEMDNVVISPEAVVDTGTCCPYAQAIEDISNAILHLHDAVAGDDPIATEAVSDLCVILFDLKHIK